MKEITLDQALAELREAGADIETLEDNSFLVRDNGFHGFCEETDPFIVDADDILEMHEQYCGE